MRRSPRARLRGRGSFVLTSGGLVSAAIAWVALVLVARVTSADEYEEFVVVWSVFFAVAGVLVGLQQQVQRALRPAVEGAPPPARAAGPPGAPVWAVGARAGLLVVPVALVAFLVVLRPSPSGTVVLVAVVVSGTTALVLASVALGVLAAEARWTAVAVVGVADQLVRLAALGTVAVLAPEDVLFVAAVHVGLVVFLPLFRTLRPADLAATERVAFGRRAAAAMVTAGCSGVLVVGLPFLVAVTGETPDEVTASLFAALYLTRSPLLVPANALRPLLLRALLERRGTVARSLLARAGVAAAGAAAVAAVAGWVAGPPLLRVVFGPGYELSGAAMSWLAVAAVVMLGLMLTGMATVALDQDAGSTLGWLVATATTIGVLLLPVGVVERCVLAMVVGPVVGIAVHVVVLVRAPSGASAAAQRVPPHGHEEDTPPDDLPG